MVIFKTHRILASRGVRMIQLWQQNEGSIPFTRSTL
ncbi:MAG: hypothetical protein RIS24_1410, partial [Verrucomicrobiota bacterium]